MAAVVVALVALTAWTGAAGGARPTAPPVLVPRCCPEGASLAPDTLALDILTREDASGACRPDKAPAPWAPRVYAPALRKYLDRGKVPPHWRVEHGVLPECDELRVLREHSAPYAFLANTASLQVPGPPAAALPPRRYCADAAAALACAEELRPAGGGAAKCCPASEALSGGRCVAAPDEGARALTVLRQLGNGSAVRVGWPMCTSGPQYAEAGSLTGAQAAEDGALELAEGGGRLGRGAWCADAAVGAAEARLAVMECNEAARARRPAAAPAHHAVYGVGLAVGAAFLAATLAAGFALPAAHHALHWRCQTYYVAALMVGDVLLAVTQLAGDAVPPPLCRALAICMHFLFLSAFFWLNTMCFNIWWTFRDFRPTSLERGQEVWRLRVYMVYAWGGPLALAGTAAALDAAPPAAALLRPRFGERHCWFYGDLEVLVYFFGPVGLLLLVNLALFASTTRQLTCGLWRRDEVKSTSERAALGRVCGKLVVVMGVTWVADVVSWAAGGPHAVWYATDLLNALQGLLIFLVVGCQPHAWAALRGAARALAARACPCCGCRAAPAPPTHSSTHLPSCGESLTHTTQAPAPPAPAAPALPALGPPKLPMETVC